jgi:hypothetical protein
MSNTSETINEAIWNRFEQAQLRKERARLIRAKIINFVSLPNVMVKDENGAWKLPSLTSISLLSN